MSLLTPRVKAILEGLPATPDLAIAYLYTEILMWREEPSGDDDKQNCHQLIALVRKLVGRHQLDIEVPPGNEFDALTYLVGQMKPYVEGREASLISGELDEMLDGIEAVAQDASFGFATLNSAEKEKIHGNIDRIRKLIEASDLLDRKKDALFDRLHQLASEVDKHGTKTDRFFAFMGDAAFVLGDMAVKAKPFTDEVKDMIKTIGRARSRKEGISLPPGEEVLRLPGPEEGGE